MKYSLFSEFVFDDVKLSGSTRMYESFWVSVDSSMTVNPKVSFVVMYACNANLYFSLTLVGYLILYGVGTIDELLVLLRLRMMLRSAARGIELDLRCLQRTPTYIHMKNVRPTYLPLSYRNKLLSIIWVQMTYITTDRGEYGQNHIK
jgi:hypothetical protein